MAARRGEQRGMTSESWIQRAHTVEVEKPSVCVEKVDAVENLGNVSTAFGHF